MRLGLIALALTAALTPVAVACSSSSSGSGGFGGSIPPPTMVGSADSTGSSRPPVADRCPATLPDDDESCFGSAASCAYGSDLRDACNIHAYCNGSVWSVPATSPCAVTCPESREEVVPGTVCDDVTMACSWSEGTCACVPAEADGGSETDAGTSGADAGPDGGASSKKGTWACAPPPTKGTCPLAVPKPGSTCVKSTTCDYGTCALRRDLTFACTGQVWTKTTPEESCDP